MQPSSNCQRRNLHTKNNLRCVLHVKNGHKCHPWVFTKYQKTTGGIFPTSSMQLRDAQPLKPAESANTRSISDHNKHLRPMHTMQANSDHFPENWRSRLHPNRQATGEKKKRNLSFLFPACSCEAAQHGYILPLLFS